MERDGRMVVAGGGDCALEVLEHEGRAHGVDAEVLVHKGRAHGVDGEELVVGVAGWWTNVGAARSFEDEPE